MMCPTCRSRDMRESHRRWTDFLALMMKAKPVRCKHCESRSYAWPWMRDLGGGKLVRR
jgi:DNA-directed RNA polymerase subunit RPC12/RpoP